ncbi:putative inorganic phosphate cotransporter isoform X1 [Fopius arisanus]|uniref:Inorganic phosphate cotransporter isoform X1 n=4 Tax=Fopius arisanus TaxID=64838 RepID=A0A9R1TGT1_9HYME|nr:PREDICTED: putative inorganic phosphate cotransporter isoform X1 [Fopius arisanus]
MSSGHWSVQLHKIRGLIRRALRNMTGAGIECGIIKDDNQLRPGLGARHCQCLLLFLGLALGYANRICMSIAVVAIEKEEDGLDSGNVGTILSSFFWGYTVMQIPSGYLARIWSAKMVLGIGILINGLGGLLCPIVFDEGGWIYLCGCRVIMGLCQACLLPCIHTLLSKWVPPNERGRLGTITYAGAQFGTVISYPISGALIDAAGWRSVFYFFGAAAITWSLIFLFIGSDSPTASAEKAFCGISEHERKYIESSLGVFEEHNADDDRRTSRTPWRAILTSVPFWALVIVHCGQNWGFWMLLTEMPIYMAGVLGFDIKENGLKSALPYVTMLILTFPVSWLSDFGERRGISRGLLRKICNTIGHWGPGIALVGICFVPPGDTTLPVVLLILAGGLNVGAICGFQINHMDLSPKYAGLLVSFTNCAASVVALLAPLIVGAMVPDSESADQWSIVFYMSGGIYFLGNLIFILFGSGKTQWWDNSENKHDDMFLRPRASSIVIGDAMAP